MPAGHRAIRVPLDLGVIMGMKIDEAWRNDEPGGIQHLSRPTPAEASYLGNLPIGDGHIADVTTRADPVNDRAPFEDNVIV